jgi:hypothetical protein
MTDAEIYADVLRDAAETIGGEALLADFLGVKRAQLRDWRNGIGDPPMEVFLRSLDVIADGPYGPRERRARTALATGS